jgi:rod shape-determining protein MreD
MIAFESLKTAVLLALAAVIQVSVLPVIEVRDATPDLALVLLASIALLRGPFAGVLAGFWAGLVLDTASLGTLGLTSLLLVLAGYWVGRFGEVTTRSSSQPPLVAVALATVVVVLGGGLLHALLGDTVSISQLLVSVLLPALGLNLLLTIPVYRLARRLYPPPAPFRRPEVTPAV